MHTICPSYNPLSLGSELYPMLFSYYAILGGSLETMKLNAFHAFLDDARLVSKKQKHNTRADFDMVFVAVNALSDKDEREREEEIRRLIELGEAPAPGAGRSGKQTAKSDNKGQQPSGVEASTTPAAAENDAGMNSKDEAVAAAPDAAAPAVASSAEVNDLIRAGFADATETDVEALRKHAGVKFDDKNGLSRVEFLVALVRIAINRYCLAGRKMSDVSEAVKCLFRDCLTGGALLGNVGTLPNAFRRMYCYQEDVVEVSHAPTRAVRGGASLFALCVRGKLLAPPRVS